MRRRHETIERPTKAFVTGGAKPQGDVMLSSSRQLRDRHRTGPTSLALSHTAATVRPTGFCVAFSVLVSPHVVSPKRLPHASLWWQDAGTEYTWIDVGRAFDCSVQTMYSHWQTALGCFSQCHIRLVQTRGDDPWWGSDLPGVPRRDIQLENLQELRTL
jgi:hypothetical protein